MSTDNRNRPVFIDGPRVYLTPLQESDAETLFRWINDHNTRGRLANRGAMSMEAEVEWIRNGNDARGVNLGIMKKVTEGPDEFIGTIGALKIDMLDRTCEIGINVGDPSARGQGFGPESTMILLNYLFNWRNMRKARWHAYAPNTPSHKCAEKCGFQVEGVLKREVFLDGDYVDVTNFTIFDEDFRPLWEKFQTENKESRMR